MPKKTTKRSREPDETAESSSSATAEQSSSASSIATAYESIDGYEIAREAKRQQRSEGVFLDGIQFGEIDPAAFIEALGWCSPTESDEFIDLGSGTGKAVLTAAAAYRLASATGVELLKPLHEAAEAAVARCHDLQTTDVKFVCADALEHPWTSSRLVFVSLTCFTDDMVERVRKDAAKLSVGSRLLVTSRPLDSDALKLIRRGHLSYGKGKMTFIAYERV